MFVCWWYFDNGCRYSIGKKFLGSKFDVKDLEEAKGVLRIKTYKTWEGLMMNQSHYIDKISRWFDHYDEEQVRIPYDSCVHLKKNKKSLVVQKSMFKWFDV